MFDFCLLVKDARKISQILLYKSKLPCVSAKTDSGTTVQVEVMYLGSSVKKHQQGSEGIT